MENHNDADLIARCLNFLRADEIYLAWAKSPFGIDAGFATVACRNWDRKRDEIVAIPASTDYAHALKLQVALRVRREVAEPDVHHPNEAAIYSIIDQFCASHPVQIQPAPENWAEALEQELDPVELAACR